MKSISVLTLTLLAPFLAFAGNTKSLSGGVHHLCKLSLDGNVECWGSVVGHDIRPPVDLGKVIAVETNYFTSCAIRPDQSLRCWGLEKEVPADLGPVKAVAIGDWHVCAIKQDSTVRCWGYVANKVKVPEDLGPVKLLTSGKDTSCAIKLNDQAVCWGAQKTDFDGLKVKSIASPHYGATCAILLDDSVKCWVAHEHNGDYLPPEDLGPVKELSSGSLHNCALTQNGKVRCWGYDSYGQTLPPEHLVKDVVSLSKTNGDYTCVLKSGNRFTCWGREMPRPPVNLGKVVQISGQNNTFCALNDIGQVRCWGNPMAKEPDFLIPVKQVSVASDVVCVVDLNDQVQCWGDNKLGQLNTPSSLNKVKMVSVDGSGMSPCAVTAEGKIKCWGTWHQDTYPPADKNYSSMIPGSFETGCAVTFDGKVHCVNNMYMSGKPIVYGVPSDLPPVKKFVMDDETYGCAITTAGDLRCFGDKNREDILPMPQLGKVRDVSLGLQSACAILESGDLSCWTHRKREGTESQPPHIKALGVAVGSGAGCAILPDYSVKCWGSLLHPEMD